MHDITWRVPKTSDGAILAQRPLHIGKRQKITSDVARFPTYVASIANMASQFGTKHGLHTPVLHASSLFTIFAYILQCCGDASALQKPVHCVGYSKAGTSHFDATYVVLIRQAASNAFTNASSLDLPCFTNACKVIFECYHRHGKFIIN